MKDKNLAKSNYFKSIEQSWTWAKLTQEEKDKQILDSYVYGDVQIFGDEKEEKND
jgi:hypothetical protein